MVRSLLSLLLLLAPLARASETEDVPPPENQDTVTAVSEVPETGTFQAPGRSRYLLSHSGMMLRAGEGFVSQKELVYTLAAVGVTDHVTVTLGSVLPALFNGREGMNFVVGVKVGRPLSERLHLAAGVEATVQPYFLGTNGIAYGSLTYGTPDAHVTVGGGFNPFTHPFAPLSQAYISGPAVLMFSGNLRLTQHLAAVTENWVFFSPGLLVRNPSDAILHDGLMVNALALRIMGPHLSVDLGAIRMSSDSSFIPIPWLDLSVHWG